MTTFGHNMKMIKFYEIHVQKGYFVSFFRLKLHNHEYLSIIGSLLKRTFIDCGHICKRIFLRGSIDILSITFSVLRYVLRARMGV